jgi:hypothetical protein
VDERPTELHVHPGEGGEPGPSAEPLPRFEEEDAPAAVAELTRRGEAGEAATDDDHIVRWIHRPPTSWSGRR